MTTKVLLVDDDSTVLAATSVALTKAGYQVESTSDVFALPLKIGTFHPDVVLLDFDLPALTGDRLAMNIRGLRSARGLKIFFHSAEDEGLLEDAVSRTGANGFIPKGLGRTEFLKRLRHLLAATA
jgi:DNA-binding response OmpR family regulator